MFSKKLKIQSNKKTKIPLYYFCIANYKPQKFVFKIYIKSKSATAVRARLLRGHSPVRRHGGLFRTFRKKKQTIILNS